MTQEEKELVIKDLCARLPYGVIVQVNDGLKGIYDRRLVQVFCDRLSCSVNVYNTLSECICIDSVKPYLRPMSSMTEDELQRYHELCDVDEAVGVGSSIEIIAVHDTPKSLDYLNSIHVDYRGLIPKELALEAPEGMYVHETKLEFQTAHPEVDSDAVNESGSRIEVGCKIRSKTNPNVILSIISDDCHGDKFECSNGSVLSLRQINKCYDLYIEENKGTIVIN